jgi:hypothetical protein
VLPATDLCVAICFEAARSGGLLELRVLGPLEVVEKRDGIALGKLVPRRPLDVALSGF